ncbi:hypothetical protein AB6806_28000 [Bosea sp. RCC_152_1]|uniref:hypothetical protein n=1 Tax=Bosea sp. RCC_152_1 TaxID=3239228 RepID=UPI003526786B
MTSVTSRFLSLEAAAALPGRQKGVALGGKARELAEKHTSAQLTEIAQSEAAAEAKAKKAGLKSG